MHKRKKRWESEWKDFLNFLYCPWFRSIPKAQLHLGVWDIPFFPQLSSNRFLPLKNKTALTSQRYFINSYPFLFSLLLVSLKSLALTSLKNNCSPPNFQQLIWKNWGAQESETWEETHSQLLIEAVRSYHMSPYLLGLVPPFPQTSGIQLTSPFPYNCCHLLQFKFLLSKYKYLANYNTVLQVIFVLRIIVLTTLMIQIGHENNR